MGKSAVLPALNLLDLDAVSLFADAAESESRPRPQLKPDVERPAPKARVMIVTPSPSKKKGRKDGRDEMLSEYLS
jgi:hypothetical protein